MPIKMFLTLLIGSIVSAALSLYNDTLGALGMFLVGCFFGRFQLLDQIKNKKDEEYEM